MIMSGKPHIRKDLLTLISFKAKEWFYSWGNFLALSLGPYSFLSFVCNLGNYFFEHGLP